MNPFERLTAPELQRMVLSIKDNVAAALQHSTDGNPLKGMDTWHIEMMVLGWLETELARRGIDFTHPDFGINYTGASNES